MPVIFKCTDIFKSHIFNLTDLLIFHIFILYCMFTLLHFYYVFILFDQIKTFRIDSEHTYETDDIKKTNI